MGTSIKNRSWYSPAVAALMTLTVFLICLALRRTGVLEPIDLKTYDILRTMQPRDSAFSSRIIVIGITEDDIHSKFFHYPILDGEMAELLQNVMDRGPRVVGVDIYRDLAVPEGQDASAPLPGRQKLVKLWNDNWNIIQVMQMGNDASGVNGMVVGPPPEIDPGQTGSAEWVIDKDDIARRGLLTGGAPDPAHKGKIIGYPSFYAQIAQIFLNGEKLEIRPVQPGNPRNKDRYVGRAFLRHFHADDGPYVNADDRGVQFLLDCRSDENFVHLTATDVIQRTQKFQSAPLKDAVVLLGVRAESVKDLVSTPTHVNAYGVDVHAATIAQLLRMGINNDPQLRYFPQWSLTLWTLLWSVGGGLLGYRVRRPSLIVAGVVGGAVLLMLSAWAGFRWNWWLPVTSPGFAWIGAAAMVGVHVSYRERTDRLLLRQLFANNTSAPIVDELWKNRDELLEEGRLKPTSLQATVMFTDLKGFSKVAEKLLPAEVIAWINQLMDPMSRLVYRHDGIIKQYAGDSIMALFGVPLAGPGGVAGDAKNAMRCALEMRRRLARINRRFQLQGEPQIQMRIGICTGSLVTGSMGGHIRNEYTVIGNTVNLASRLESFDKTLLDPDIADNGCRILIDEKSLAFLDAEFQTRYLTTRELTGDQPIRIHGVIGAAKPIAPAAKPATSPIAASQTGSST